MQARVEVRQFIERRPKAKSPYGIRFMMVSQQAINELSQRLADHTVRMTEVRVLMAMMQHMDWENRVDAPQKTIALDLGISQSKLAQASRVLVECGFIERMQGRRGWYRVSPKLCWKGSVKNLEQELAKAA